MRLLWFLEALVRNPYLDFAPKPYVSSRISASTFWTSTLVRAAELRRDCSAVLRHPREGVQRHRLRSSAPVRVLGRRARGRATVAPRVGGLVDARQPTPRPDAQGAERRPGGRGRVHHLEAQSGRRLSQARARGPTRHYSASIGFDSKEAQAGNRHFCKCSFSLDTFLLFVTIMSCRKTRYNFC